MILIVGLDKLGEDGNVKTNRYIGCCFINRWNRTVFYTWGAWTTQTLIKVDKRKFMEVKLSAIAERLEEIQIGYIQKSNEEADYKVTFTEEN